MKDLFQFLQNTVTMKKLTLLLAVLLLVACTGAEQPPVNNDNQENTEQPDNGDKPNDDPEDKPNPKPEPEPEPEPEPTITHIIPTTDVAPIGQEVKHLRLMPGKLIGLEQVTTSVCDRAIKANMYIDVIARDKNMWAEGATNELRELVFFEAGKVIRETGVNLWGMHLPHTKYDIASLDETHRREAVQMLSHIIDIAIEHIGPQHIVIHPSTGAYLTTDADFEQHRAASRKSLVALQQVVDKSNAQYGRKSILCVENCSKSVAYDGESMLSLLNFAGLENTRVCLDTGHALIPQNGKYASSKDAANVVDILKTIGTKLGTLHIQQNIGLKEYPYDKHLNPWAGGLINWGEFYYELLYSCGYRGCFLYETSWVDVYEGDTKATIENVRKNYDNIIVPEYEKWVK